MEAAEKTSHFLRTKSKFTCKTDNCKMHRISIIYYCDSIVIPAEDNKIIIKKVVCKKHITLEERLKDYYGDYTFEEADWGNPAGNEIW